MKADADDPAIYVNATDASRSLVVTAVKNGGVRVYSLKGKTLQTIAPPAKGSRINNIDVVYGFKLADGSRADLAVASDRGLDYVRIWRIDPDAAEPLHEITDESEARAFPKRPSKEGQVDEDNPVDDQNTIYGLAAWTDRTADKVWVAGTQRHQPVIGIFTLEARPDNKVAAVFSHDVRVPTEHKGQSLLAESDDDPLKDWSPQFEGSVFDRTTGMLYAGQEDVGIWRVDARDASQKPVLLYETRGAAGSSFHNPESRIARDVEGLTIYYADSGTRYLLASSQGSAHGDGVAVDAPYDDSYAVFKLDTELELLGSFRVGAKGDIDADQESDGADVISLGLPGFENGLFVVQDGYAGDLNGLDGKTAQTNFKFVDWKAIADTFTPPLEVTPKGFDPRK